MDKKTKSVKEQIKKFENTQNKVLLSSLGFSAVSLALMLVSKSAGIAALGVAFVTSLSAFAKPPKKRGKK